MKRGDKKRFGSLDEKLKKPKKMKKKFWKRIRFSGEMIKKDEIDKPKTEAKLIVKEIKVKIANQNGGKMEIWTKKKK